MKNITKYGFAFAVAAIVIAAASLGVLTTPTTAQPAPGYSLISPTKIVASGGNWTNRIVGSTAVTVGTRIDCRAGQKLALQFKGELTGAGTTVNTVALSRNVDGSTNREVFATFGVTANGATAVNTNSLYDVGAIPFVYIEYITNHGTVTLTNYSLWYNVK